VTTIKGDLFNNTFSGCGPANVLKTTAIFFCYTDNSALATLIFGFDTSSGEQVFLLNFTCDLPGASGYNTLVDDKIVFSASCDLSTLQVFAIDFKGNFVWNATLPNVEFSAFGASPMIESFEKTLVVSTGTHLVQLDSRSGAVVSETKAYADDEASHVAYLCSAPSNHMA
jgi:outer membrane protein assembly factor BamB